MKGLYNPLTYDNLMTGLVAHFEKQESSSLSGLPDIVGPGIYSLAYAGGLDVYRGILGSGLPIYVGKAVPPGARKGSTLDTETPALKKRLVEHLESVRSADNLKDRDFTCQYLAVEPVWITLAERFLIDHYKPVWNLCLDGFGNHNPGGGRKKGKKSWWDTLHPGRAWARELPADSGKTMQAAEKRVGDFLAGRPLD